MSESLPPLKEGYTEHFASDGTPYYYHAESNESVWERPVSEKYLQEQTEKAAAAALSVTPSNGDTERDELNRKISARDGIMEIDIGKTIKKFLAVEPDKKKDTIEELVEKLSENYIGAADLVNLLIGWLDITATAKPKADIAISINPNANPNDSKSGEELVIDHLKSILVQRFQPDLVVDELQSSQGPPLWLKQMLENKAWRHLLIVLAGKHENVPLLDFAVKAITQKGLHSEISDVADPSRYFQVFNRTIYDLMNQLISIDAYESTSAWTDAAKVDDRFKKICSKTQFSYLYASEVLSIIEHFNFDNNNNNENKSIEHDHTYDSIISQCKSKLAEDGIPINFAISIICKIRKLRQSLDNQVQIDPKSKDSFDLLLPINRRNINGLAASVENGGHPELSTLLRIALSNRAFSSDMLAQLSAKYKQATMPPLWPLRQPVLLGILIKQLYAPSEEQALDETFIDNGCFMLAVATTCQDNNTEKVAALHQVFKNSLNLCRNYRASISNVKSLCELIKTYPPVSAGSLRWIRSCFINNSNNKTSYEQNTKVLLYIFRFIITSHPLQHSQACYVLQEMFLFRPETVDITMRISLQRFMINEMIVLIEHGYTIPVIEFMKFQASNNTDYSLLRYFILKLLKTCGPPYTLEFAIATKLLLSCPSVIKASVNETEITTFIDEFNKEYDSLVS